MKKVILFLFGLVLITSCTENQQAKQWGGTASITLPKNRKLVSATWKDANLWYLTRPMNKNEKAETYYFHEESSFGMMEGTYVIKESK